MASPEPIDTLERDVADALFDLQPTFAVSLGRHEYDGKLPAYAPEATDRWLGTSEKLLARVTGLDDGPLSPDRRVDRFLLRLVLEGARFDLTEARRLEQNPLAYLGVLYLSPYLARNYAPPPTRAEAIGSALGEVPRLLAEGRQRLAGPLPKPFVELALAIGAGLPSHFLDAEAFATQAGAGPAVADRRAAAEQALGAFLGWLKDEELPRAVRDFALGPERYQRLLFVREGVEAPFADLERAGVADLAHNRSRLEAIAHREHQPVSALLSHLQHDRATPETLLDAARGYVEESRRFVESNDLVTIPGPVDCRVEETPVWGRATSTASMDSPGPFDARSTEGIYYVTLVDPRWTPEQQQEWLRTMNRPMLRNTAVHEVYPGHYVQALHFRATAGSLARKIYLSPSYIEGWAHYAELLAIEAGLGAGSPAAEVTQILDALLRDCRLIASVRMHTAGWSVDDATRLFEREAFLDPLPAQREALRGTIDPEYFCYTLGKLAILDVRKRHLASRFGGRLKEFHDALLKFGCLPVGLLDGLVGGAAAVATGGLPASPPGPGA